VPDEAMSKEKGKAEQLWFNRTNQRKRTVPLHNISTPKYKFTVN